MPALQPAVIYRNLEAKAPGSSLAWPSAGQAAVGIAGTDIVEPYGEQKPVPIASTAKVITALVVLEKKPLKLGQQGPAYTLTEEDANFYRSQLAKDGSNLPVSAGQQITQYQMIQAIMLPSANNIADTMAIWAFGSLEAYARAANDYLTRKGLDNTEVGGDASGLAPSTTSTAVDLVKLGKLAMGHPVLAEIVGQKEATGLPNSPISRNVNSLLGTSNIIGVKTGNTDQAGGVFISASRINVNDRPVTLVTAVAGAADLGAALRSSLSLVQTAQNNFQRVSVVKEDQLIAEYGVPWGGRLKAVADSDLEITAWNGHSAKATVQLSPAQRGDKVTGKINLNDMGLYPETSVPVSLTSQPTEPSIWWRLTHPLN
jgi:serine-type D-Ala-D-Ala carboxypeptidase (penicillin-binding protein 5/6)